jgi:hypothetical protein
LLKRYFSSHALKNEEAGRNYDLWAARAEDLAEMGMASVKATLDEE